MDVQDIKDLIQAVDQSTIDELEYEQDGKKLVLKKVKTGAVVQTESYQPVRQAEAPQAPVSSTPVSTTENSGAETSKNENLHTVTSPMVGTFYSSPSPDDGAYVSVGDQVKEDSIVCIVEAMKLMNEIEADINGKIVEIVAQNGELVEYGQPLFVVELK
ncbi:acetyl-CoA carboxylase biotin carboxyl carrier protein [Alkalicoccobacillus murimartini]|uniref:Biotin carboxyl carrier protein of acetyl-CoA carboxylase n=1 Tax=Alkalicoccobacillus murimartini TaxID=171685 RepID=A0ABT9YPK6_9BACI|nr:acetyl-CoA carboxylase biotin carboxyl carrier protein [Alkalicoccobacillus murimartini]MDQ0208964.1 acetyl-CoA carboxylase biotin carboxyl carrier protein [Alkalicoccobacillus murimartini]